MMAGRHKLAERYKDRLEAGRRLAAALKHLRGQEDIVVLALPRGGVPVAFSVAQSLGALLDVLVVRKLGVPGHEELAMGAIAAGGGRAINQSVVVSLNLSPEDIAQAEAREKLELERRVKAYRGARPWPLLEGRTVVLVDDGLATGASMKAALESVKNWRPAKVIVAVPVAPPETIEEISLMADEVICPLTPPFFEAVGSWYENFPQTSDEEVKDLLARSGA